MATGLTTVSDLDKNRSTASGSEEQSETYSVHSDLNDLSKFKVEKVLHNNTNRKVVCLQGAFDSIDGIGLIVLEKTAFEEDTFTQKNKEFFSEENCLKKYFHNDIYGNYEYYPKTELNSMSKANYYEGKLIHVCF